MKYHYKIVRVTKKNYARFEDMIFWRENEFECIGLRDSMPGKMKKELKNPNLFVYAVEIEDRFVGWISLVYIPKISKWRSGGYVFVDELWIAPMFRGLGLSKILMARAEKLKKKLCAVGIRLYVNTENQIAQNLYRSCEYAENGQAIFMEK